jgi:hypothetical protein
MESGPTFLSEPEAHEELLIMNSRVSYSSIEYFLDAFRRRDLGHQDVLDRIAQLISETRVSYGRIVYLGKIIVQEILEFMNQSPEIPSGMQLQTALRVLNESAPFLGPLIGPLSSEVEFQGYGKLYAGTGFTAKFEQQARIFFKRFSSILNLNKTSLLPKESADFNAETFEEPALFDLDDSENLFDLDDLSEISSGAKTIVKFLSKLAISDGRFNDPEKAFVWEILDNANETVTPSQFERLVLEGSKESLETLLQSGEHQAVTWKEKLLIAGMLMAASDGKVDLIEKKYLVQSSYLLGISKERYSQLSKDAMSLIKSRRSLAGAPPPKAVEGPPPVQAIDSAEDSRVPSRLQISGNSIPQLPGKQESPVPEVDLPPLHSKAPEQPAQALPVAPPAIRRTVSPAAPPQEKTRRIWRCPACNMPQFHDFEECPQCGIIKSKYLAKHDYPDTRDDEYLEIPEEPSPAPNQDIVAESPHPAAPKCPGCGEPVLPDAKFCISCGARIR